MHLLITLLLTIIGWQIMRILRVPAAPLLGPMLFIGAAEIMGLPISPLPNTVLLAVQLTLGLFVGVRIDREKIEFLKQGMLIPSLLVVGWTIVFTLAPILLLTYTTNFDLATILFGATPGGMAEMSIIALNYNADIAVVSLLQFMRLVMVLILVPLIAAKVIKVEDKKVGAIESAADSEVVEKQDLRASLQIIGSGLLIGGLSIYLGFPAGGIIGTSIGVGAASIYLGKRVELPGYFLKIAQLGIGLTIGTQFRPDTVTAFLSLMIPGMLFSILVVLGSVILAIILGQLTKWDLSTTLLCTAPAGVSQMIMVASDLGVDMVKVTYFHVLRLMTIYLIISQIYQWYLH